jgi:transposase InsO family protein
VSEGLPSSIRVDQGTEFVSRDLDLWAHKRGVTLDFSRPGKPTDNAFIEAFAGNIMPRAFGGGRAEARATMRNLCCSM